MTANKTTALPKTAILYLLMAGLIDFGLAFFPVWSLTDESGLLEHFAQLFRVMVQDTAKQPRELVAVFWLPFSAGVICLGAVFASLFVSSRPASTAVIFTPLAITIAALAYFLAMRTDIHILVISLLPLAAAWWEYHKSKRGAQPA